MNDKPTSKIVYTLSIFFLLGLLCVLLPAAPSFSRLRFEQSKSMKGIYNAKAACSVVIDNRKYDADYCRIVVSASDNDTDLYFGPASGRDEVLHNVTIKTKEGEIRGMWSGPEAGLQRPDTELGSLVQDGDCWLNKKVRICVSDRVSLSTGKCFLKVKDRVYFNGKCPIETYTPLGDLYINGTCRSASKYTARVAINADGTGTGFWNGDPPASQATLDLGRLKRQGPCWANEKVQICAEKGQAMQAQTCRIATSALPDGYSAPVDHTILYEPDGTCAWELLRSASYSGACGISADNNNKFRICGRSAASDDCITITSLNGTTTGTLATGFQSHKQITNLGPLRKDGRCWIGKGVEKICVTSPLLSEKCDKNGACHWNIFK